MPLRTGVSVSLRGRTARVGTVVNPPGATGVHKAYRVVGMPIHPSTVSDGDSTCHDGTNYCFPAAISAELTAFIHPTQGVRHYLDYDDWRRWSWQTSSYGSSAHSCGNSGKYSYTLYPTTDGQPVTGTVLATTNVDLELGKQVDYKNASNNTVSGWKSANYPQSGYSSQPSATTRNDYWKGNGNAAVVGGTIICGLAGKSALVQGQSKNGNDAWDDQPAVGYAGMLKVELYQGDGSDTTKRYTAAKGDWLVCQSKNNATDPWRNFAHDNGSYCPASPTLGNLSSVDTPLDSMIRMYHKRTPSSISLRTPIFYARYKLSDGTYVCYGQPYYYANYWIENSGVPSNENQVWAWAYGKKAFRQVLTPRSDYTKERMKWLYVHAWRNHLNKDGYKGEGALMVRIRRAPLGNNAASDWVDYWPSSGWAKIASGETKKFGIGANGCPDKSPPNYEGGGDDPRSKFRAWLDDADSEGVDKIWNWVKLDVTKDGTGSNAGSFDLQLDPAYHYAVEIKAEWNPTASTGNPKVTCCYNAQPNRHPFGIMTPNTGTANSSGTAVFGGMDIRDECKQVWYMGEYDSTDKRAYNCVQMTSDITVDSPVWSTWNTKGSSSILPVCLVPLSE